MQDMPILEDTKKHDKMNYYTYEQVLEAATEYFSGDEFAAKVFVDKYALQTSKGEYLELTPTDMHKRLAKEFARIEKKYPNPLSEEDIFSLLDRFKYIVPQGSPMSAIGNNYKLQSLGNCFVIEPPYDSYGGILKSDQELAQLMKRRCGVGLDISNIRPKGMTTMNASKTTDGIGIFMERFSNTCREVAQGGRRGALLQSISIKHPEIDTFINIKRDLKKVTGANISIKLTDDFMKAVKNKEKFKLQWPVDSNNPEIVQEIDAKELWDKIIESAWTTAEPGIFFWDHLIENSIPDLYAETNSLMKTTSSNPCFSGETLIAVADGRNAVSIKQLAEEEKDVPVYSMDKKTGQISIKMGRHPRITGHNKKLVRITLDDGSFIDTTPDHKFILLDGSIVEAQDLQYGQSLPRFTKSLEPVKTGSKDYYVIHCNTRETQKNKIFEHRLIAKFYNPEKWNDIYNSTKENGFVKTGGIVVHHKDYNQLNNSPDNLEIMSFRDHAKLHGEIDQSGEKNGRYSGFSSEEIKKHALILTQNLQRRFSKKEWQKYAKIHNLPIQFSQFRINELGGSIVELAKECALELGFNYIDSDPRCAQTYNDMLDQGYDARIIDNIVLVEKTCEICHHPFEVSHDKREQAICSNACKAIHLDCDSDIKKIRAAASAKVVKNRIKNVKQNQARIYSELEFNLKRPPLMKEWERVCKEQNVPRRVGRKLKFGFKNFKEVADAGQDYNHKIVGVKELEGDHAVYNITVDDNHTVAVITSIKEKRDNRSFSGILLSNCGEIPLGQDSCRLLVVNLTSFVINPFTEKAKFNYKKFHDVVIKAQRLMDDIVDLEIESMNKIINKIKKDPEPKSVKEIELNLWKTFLETCTQGRRTGLGITGLGDCLAMLNIKYGSKESIETTESIYKSLAIGAHTSSCVMAKERGAFPLFDYELEKNHAYINSIINSCDKSVKKMWHQSGRRNIALTTTAPTGSVSTLTQTTSGIEPAYLLSYVRRKKINPSEKNAKVDFVDQMGDKWQEFTIYHHGVKQWMDATGEKDITKSPYWGATSNDVDWVASVDLQAAAQKYIDHSISKTCVSKDTLIDTKNGLYYMDELIDFSEKNKTIELSNSDIEVKTHNNVYVKPTYIHTMDNKPIIQLELENGLSIKVSPREQFMYLDEETGLERWKYIEDLSIGDRLKINKL